MSKEEIIELFDQYYYGQLTKPEQLTFEEKLSEDSDFKKEYDAYLKSIEIINVRGFRNDLEKIIGSKPPSQIRLMKREIWIPLAAASVLIPLILFVWSKFSHTSNESLVRMYYQPYPNILASRGSSDELGKALEIYANGDYKNANALLKHLSPSDTVLFYRGLCQLSLNQVDSALYLLNQLNRQSIFYAQTNWYSGLAALLKDDMQTTVSRYNQIKPGQFRYSESQELLKKIR